MAHGAGGGISARYLSGVLSVKSASELVVCFSFTNAS